MTPVQVWPAGQKSLAELKRGIVEGPYELEDIPFSSPTFVPRVGIWERHGSSTEPSVRNIDNLLVTGHNATVATFSAHRPTDADALLGQARCVRDNFPEDELSGWPSDYEKAFKQIPGCPKQVEKLVLLQWNPHTSRVNAWVAYSQLFGGKSPPLNFSRYPAWACQIVAVLLGLPMTHCVDDMIVVEPAEWIMSGWRCWKRLNIYMGWYVSE